MSRTVRAHKTLIHNSFFVTPWSPDLIPATTTQVHYLGDPGRGSVWEETIINCPPHIVLLAMSATIANADDLGGWISQVCDYYSSVMSADLGIGCTVTRG